MVLNHDSAVYAEEFWKILLLTVIKFFCLSRQDEEDAHEYKKQLSHHRCDTDHKADSKLGRGTTEHYLSAMYGK